MLYYTLVFYTQQNTFASTSLIAFIYQAFLCTYHVTRCIKIVPTQTYTPDFYDFVEFVSMTKILRYMRTIKMNIPK